MKIRQEFEKPITYRECEFCGALVEMGEDVLPHLEMSLVMTNGVHQFNKDNLLCLCPSCLKSFTTWFRNRKQKFKSQEDENLETKEEETE